MTAGAGTPFSANQRMIEREIERRVAENAEAWFPRGGRPTVRLQLITSRPRALLYAVYTDNGQEQPTILAKVRREVPQAVGNEDSRRRRPRLASDQLSVSQLTALEYAGLRSIHAMFADASPMFGAVRPLDHLVGLDTILMNYVSAGTLRQLLVQESRLSVKQRSARNGGRAEVWGRAGMWLRTFQQSMPIEDRPARQPRRADVVDRFDAYQEFLGNRIGRRSFGDIATRGAQLAQSVLPERLPMVVGHGDYAPRNAFAADGGRLMVFDPMPRWAVPCHEDLCRFLVALRLMGLQLHSHGLAYGSKGVERRESQVIRGYYGESPVPMAQVYCYQLLIMLDKWSALADESPRSWRTQARAVSVRLAIPYLRSEAARLLSAAESG
jgi:hypothetical protein